ncbi:MAG TPA: hypothetical protein VFM05_15160 [Candidatus Saccharimonadales bacterium]|nr:hypothetical protein [Candidatus Saccharimonadales bacterium]
MQESSFEGAQIQFIAMQQDANCYGQVYPPYQAGSPFYSSSDTSICNTGFSTGTTTGVGPGEALINAGWTADAWFFGPFGVCDYTPEEVLRDAICNVISLPVRGNTAYQRRMEYYAPGFSKLTEMPGPEASGGHVNLQLPGLDDRRHQPLVVGRSRW